MFHSFPNSIYLTRHHSMPDTDLEQIQTPSATATPVPRSCYACNRNKIRCNRSAPCSSCTRSGKQCSYPPSGPRIRRLKKTIMAEMASRISSLEKSLAQATAEQKTSQSRQRTPLPSTETETTTSSAKPARETRPGNLSEKSREDIVVQKGSSSQYFNEILLSRVIEEVSFPAVDSKSTAIWFLIAGVGKKHRGYLNDAGVVRITAAPSISIQCLGNPLLPLCLTTTFLFSSA